MTFNVQRPQVPQLPEFGRRARIAIVVVAVVIVLLILWSVFVDQYTELLWFRSVGYSSVFSRRLGTELLLFFSFGAAIALIVALNVVIAYRLRPKTQPASPEQEQLEHYRTQLHRWRGWLLGAVVTLIGIITGAHASSRWRTWMLWRNGQPFHIKDPQFGKDISYFTFTYPMQRFLLGTLFAIIIVSLIGVLITSYLYGSVRLQTPGPKWTPAARVHVSILLGIFLLLKAVAYWLDRYGLAFSGRGIVTGPSYTDVHAVLPAKTILVFVAIICALLFFANIVTRNWLLPAVGFGLMVLAALIIGGLYPLLIQHFKVGPSAQDLEAKYIQRDINATQQAYGIGPNRVSESANYPGVAPASVSAKSLRTDADNVAQLRVLDPNVVSQTFDQLQQERSYYSFPNTLDVDRYTLPGSTAPTDVVIGTRDIDLSGLQPSQRNWINEHLVYTHGYGVVAAQADTTTVDGQPTFIEQDLPPKGDLGNFQPRIYFGEGSPSYSIVGAPKDTKPRELDRPADNPAGQLNYTYTGDGGIPIGSTFRQLMFAWKYKDKNILLSSGVNADSRLLTVRDPRQRVAKVAPWLTLDGDPYPVVVNGSIEWVVDGYTTTDGFPYSEQQSLSSATRTSLTSQNGATVASQRNTSINYIRNSVKATVNAFTGQVTLYAWDQTKTQYTPDGTPDPVLQTWEKAFPGVVKPQSDMPSDLIAHLRYPEDLFNIQRTLLARYHVTNPKSFYGGTQFWNVPNDPTTAAGQTAVPQPAYYQSLSPSGSTTAPPVFSLTSPLVSLNRRNLTAFLSVDSQPGPGYGQFELLELPSDQATDGPQQVQNNIESTPAVSTQLTLLRQGGSRVSLGNLLTVPIDGGLLYVEPIYVQSAGSGAFPVLREIAAFYNGTVAYQSTLSASLDQVFGLPITSTPTGTTTTPTGPSTGNSGSSGPTSTALATAIAQAQAAETAASAALKRGDLEAYAREQKAVAQALSQIANATGAPSSTSTPSPNASPSASVSVNPTVKPSPKSH